jgi:hypothetical protein
VIISRARGFADYSWNPVSVSSDPRNRPPTPLTIDIEGLPEMPIERLRISDVIALGKGELRAHHKAALELRNVQMDAEGRPAFLIRDSRDLELDGVTSRKRLPGSR